MQIKVLVRQAWVPQPFFVAHTDPQHDVDVSGQIADSALYEHGFTWIW